MSRFFDYIAFWRNWDDKERSNAKVIAGLATAVFSLFILISCFSYLFHWQQDMSLLGDPAMLDSSTGVGNAAGKLGYRTGHLLIGELFGLGSFAFLVILTAISVRLIGRRWHFSLIKTTLLALTGALVASLLLAFAGNLAGSPDAFGGGLGGECGNGCGRNYSQHCEQYADQFFCFHIISPLLILPASVLPRMCLLLTGNRRH